MNGRVLLDTNILVYLYDGSDSDKQAKAFAAVDRLIRSQKAVISPQILGEFFVATTRTRRQLLTPNEAAERICNYWAACSIVPVTGAISLEATRGVLVYQMSFWDAQIWATAKLNQIQHIYSEDFSTGAIIEGVEFLNPFL
ncbi:PIN domain-containing protein [Synechococcus sp. PCC 7336]|uniref:PIN domain-containing protein n=1 Tax=Synechococcus sp. PCC 7336 TaxID=195250 RepID=UPI000345A5A1|nr:PIN domain-containing protein [Synechococcus sp. PCC 7336]